MKLVRFFLGVSLSLVLFGCANESQELTFHDYAPPKSVPVNSASLQLPIPLPNLRLPTLSLNFNPIPSAIDFHAYQPAGTDVTETYLGFFDDADQSELPDDLQKLKNYKIILVEGILANQFDFIGKLVLNRFGQLEYFYDYMDWFKSVGIEYQELAINTQASANTNQAILAEAIQESTKPVLIIPHSKGGVETIMALSYNPQLLSKVAGVVFLQSPFMGTPIADDVEKIPFVNTQANNILQILGGTGLALEDLTSYERVPWMKQWGPVTEAILTQVPMLSLSTWKDDLPGQDTAYEFTRDLMLLQDRVANDGMIPWNSMILPHSRYVKVQGNDHLSTVSNDPYIHLDRVRFIKALLRTLFAN